MADSVNIMDTRFDQTTIESEEIERRLEQYLLENGLTMPRPAAPKGAYQTIVVSGDRAYLAGHLPIQADGSLITGRLGVSDVSGVSGVSTEADVRLGYLACQWAGLNLLATLKSAIGSLDRVKQVAKITGFIQCSDAFHAQPAVLNGTSELMAAVFGPGAGQAARSAVGANSLPLDAMVEVEAEFVLNVER